MICINKILPYKPNLKIILIIFTLLQNLHSFSQFERFKTYDVSNGICHAFVYAINQDKDGFVWIGTGEGLCRFNGYEFESFSNADSLSNDVVSASYKDSFGNLWFGFGNGLILSWDGEKFRKFKLPIENPSGITSISQSNAGEIFITTQGNGCFTISSEGKVKPAEKEFLNKLISCVLFTDSYLFLGTNEGLEIIPTKKNEFLFENTFNLEELQFINIQVIRPYGENGDVLIGTEDAGLFLLKIANGKFSLTSVGPGSILANQNIQDILIQPDKSVWICTYYAGLIKIKGLTEKGTFSSISGYDEQSGLITKYIKTIFSDREGNIWLGTYGNGIALLAEQAFVFMSFNNYLKDNNILSVTSNDSIVWVGGEDGLLQINLNNPQQKILYNSNQGLPFDKITALCYDKNIVWIGTEKNGIYKLNTKTRSIKPHYKSDNSIGNSINYLKVDNNTLYAATKDGILNFDIRSGQYFQYKTEDGLPHNDIKHIYIDSQYRLIFATRANGIFEINDRGEIQEYFTVGKYALEFNSITQDILGNVWVSTYGQGIFLLLPDTVINFTAKNGLKSNYCYSISTADSNYVWVGHRLGLSRINISDFSVKTFDLDIGIKGDCNHNSFATNGKGKLFFGTTDGLIIYDTHIGKGKSVPPKANILRVLINDKEVDFNKPIVLPYAAYKLRIEYVGLCYNDPNEVKYQYKLQGYDLGWSEVTDLRFVIYSRVEDGDFKFQLRSFGHDGQYDDELSGFSLRIKPPIWKRWWFIILMVGLFVLVIIAIIKYREKQQKALQEYLEKSLDERTREVVEQKEVIEIKNRDITDSINYAQRIQNSILPPIKKLQQNFSGSFIFYQPRDIVSGDFYWFDKVSKDKFIIVCADSTGHGVPGAFMSLIGTTLIKDICNAQKVSSPADLLRELDLQLSGTLNQNIDEVKSNDGMDIMICEIDTATNYMRCASAMRPMILYKNGEMIYVKGSRNSIGGQYDSKDAKDFEHEEYQLSKGDLIYLFSDGYPDQFGGPMGKKFKMVRLKNLIKDIQKKPMEEQYEYVKSTFNLWREDFEQVDDVLFMGIKI